jgi:gas vesicle protein
MGTFLKENAEYFEKKAKEAYITSKYLDKEYSEKTARKALEVLDEFKRRFEKWLE